MTRHGFHAMRMEWASRAVARSEERRFMRHDQDRGGASRFNNFRHQSTFAVAVGRG
jgi:hypothetical protein